MINGLRIIKLEVKMIGCLYYNQQRLIKTTRYLDNKTRKIVIW